MIPWIMIGALGAGTALSYTSLSETFPKSASARANGALNLLHMGMAFVVQAALGFVIELWPADGGRYPVVAYQTAFGLNLALQSIALAWFFLPRGRIRQRVLMADLIHTIGGHTYPRTPYERAAAVWNEKSVMAQRQAKSWPLAAVLSCGLAIVLAGSILILAINTDAIPYILQA